MADDKADYAVGKNPNSLKNLRPVKKGEVRNPDGGRAHDPAKKALKYLSNEMLKEVIDVAVKGDLEKLAALAQSRTLPVLQVAVAKCMYDAVARGDWSTVERIVERCVGKVKEEVEITGISAPQVIVKLPSNGREIGTGTKGGD